MVTVSCEIEDLIEMAGEKGTAPIDRLGAGGNAEIKCLFTQSLNPSLSESLPSAVKALSLS